MIKESKIKSNELEPRQDCVKMMREIRNLLDAKFATMNWIEQKKLIEQLAKGEVKII
jgi:hypothetical protein